MTTVLFVEDQIELRAVHAAYLQFHGFRVLTADDGEVALDVARRQHPDLIVLDHALPHRTGIEVARELKRDASTSDIPIVMLTAMPYGAIGKKARAAGCDLFLAKPCQPSRLLQEISRFVSASNAA
jgi:two-component system, cell cycle response regulator DivK